MNLETKLLRVTAESRFRLMKRVWNQPVLHDRHKDLISRELSQLREEIFSTITSSDILSVHPLCKEIAEDEEIPIVRKNISILAIYGIGTECIADLNCVNEGYARMCIKSLKEEYPELFR